MAEHHRGTPSAAAIPIEVYQISQHIACWKSRQRGRKQALWESAGGFGARLFATLEKQASGIRSGSYGLEAETSFLSRGAAIREFSRRAPEEHVVEVRTATRIICRRPPHAVSSDRAAWDHREIGGARLLFFHLPQLLRPLPEALLARRSKSRAPAHDH